MKNRIPAYIALLSIAGNISLLSSRNASNEKQEIEKKKPVEKRELVDKSLIDAIITVESNWNSKAYNKHTGAIGLMQLTPVIYKKLCGLTKEEAFNPEKNRACGELFVKHLLNKYKGNVEKTLLHYNNGYTITNHQYDNKVLARMKK